MAEFSTIEVPGDLRNNIEKLRDGHGISWLESLPGTIAELAARWKIIRVEPFDRQSFNFTAVCSLEDGTKAVMKIGFPEEEDVIAKQAAVLEHYGASRSPRLLGHDDERNAILIERLKPGKTLDEAFPDRPASAVDVAAELIGVLPRDIPKRPTFHSLKTWFGTFENDTSAILPEQILDAGKDALEKTDIRGEQLLHGDFHHGNIVSSGKHSFKVIDPEGAIGHRGYESAVFLNQHYRLYREREDIDRQVDYALERFCGELDLERKELVRWAVCQIVLCMAWDAEDFGKYYDLDLKTAEYWLERLYL